MNIAELTKQVSESLDPKVGDVILFEYQFYDFGRAYEFAALFSKNKLWYLTGRLDEYRRLTTPELLEVLRRDKTSNIRVVTSTHQIVKKG